MVGQATPWGCSSATDGFTMLRVRVRANAYFASVWGPYSTGNRPRSVTITRAGEYKHEIQNINCRCG